MVFIISVACLIVGCIAGFALFRYVATGKYRQIIEEASKEAEVIKEKKLLEVKEKFLNKKSELEKEVQLPLVVFIKKVLLETCTGISFVDSTPLACLPQPTDTGLQDLRRTCRARKMFHGMVFRVQTSSDY